MCATDHGLHVRPQSGLLHSNASSVCGTFVLAKMTAPAARSVSTSYGDDKVCAWAREMEKPKEEKRTAASRSAGLLAHCVYPIVLSNPFTSTTPRI